MSKSLSQITVVIVGLLCHIASQSMAQPPQETAPTIGRLLGNSRDLNPAVIVSDRPVLDRQVLIYYTNEPNVSAYQNLRNIMAEQPEPKFKKAVERIDNELKRFPEALAAEVSAIQSKTPSSVGAIVFTNEMARKGECLVHPFGSDEFQLVRFEFAQPKPIDQTLHPLSSPDVFAAAIDKVGDLFSPDQHSFVLVTKAHGTEKLAMATIMGQILDVTSAAEMVARFALLTEKKGKHLLKSPEGKLSPELSDKLTPEMMDTLNPDPLVDNTLSPDMGDTLGGKILVTGMTKMDLYNALQKRANERGLFISLYFADACHSETLPPHDESKESKAPQVDAAKPAIGTVFASDTTGLRYTTLNYNDVFDTVGKGESLVNSMRRHLSEAQQNQQHIPAKSK